MWPHGRGPRPSVERWLRPLLDGARPGAGARGRAARLGREVGQEVSGLSRRGPGLRDLGRESEMGEDPADHTRILNGREQAHAPPTARTREDIKLEGAPHEVRPRPIARLAGSLLLQLHVAARARANGTCFHQRGRRALVGHGAGTPASMGSKNSVVQHEIDARARSQGGELFEEFQGLEEEVVRAIVPGALELQQDATVRGEPKTVLGGRAG